MLRDRGVMTDGGGVGEGEGFLIDVCGAIIVHVC